MTPEQRKENSHKGGLVGGCKTYEERRGIHGLTPEQRSEISRDGGLTSYSRRKGVHGRTQEQMKEHGLIGGRKLLEEGRGIHGLTPEQRKENSHKAIISMGRIPITEDEKRFAYKLLQDPYFQRGKQVRVLRIAQALNGNYHQGQEVRTAAATYEIIRKYRKSLESRTQSS
ncbi:MAG TPA: hypothetical protein VJK07_02295 [Candidatus Nanoarchaeia archaeon]|nr:hypothetical protein [Candidatus Nanoarchaeia archaeon]